VPEDLDRRLAREARRRGGTRSEVARSLLSASLQATPLEDPRKEAQRQSRLAAAQADEREVLKLVVNVADLRGWK
jgi:hypothetical protein